METMNAHVLPPVVMVDLYGDSEISDLYVFVDSPTLLQAIIAWQDADRQLPRSDFTAFLEARGEHQVEVTDHLNLGTG